MLDALLGLLQQSPPSAETSLDRHIRNRLRYESLLGPDKPGRSLLEKQENTAESLRNLGNPNVAPIPKPNPIRQRMNFVESTLLKDYSPEVTAAIMGNIDVESGGSFDPLQKQKLSGGGVGKGRGLFQMETGGKMLDAYRQFIKNNNMPNTASSQISFVSEALKDDSVYDIGSGHRKKLKEAFKSKDVDFITKEFMARFLRPGKPHLEKRLESSRNFMKKNK